MAFENLITETKSNIYYITINRPDKLNALNKKTIEELGIAVSEAEKAGDVRVIILTGAGTKAFVAGADISEFADFNDRQGEELSAYGQKVFSAIEQCNKPVIAAINGFALGGGCELAMACHIRVASDNARFGQPEVKLGLIPGYGGTQRLPRLIGRNKATELLLTADMMNAQDALQWGLVNDVVPAEQLISKCEEIAKKIIAQAPLAVAATLRCVQAYYDKQKNGIETEVKEFGKCFSTDDVKEGTKAFLEKRAPVFKGA
jgi:enoyl-CoA hydratase